MQYNDDHFQQWFNGGMHVKQLVSTGNLDRPLVEVEEIWLVGWQGVMCGNVSAAELFAPFTSLMLLVYIKSELRRNQGAWFIVENGNQI